MNGQIGNHREGESISSMLRHAAGDQDFDYPALVAGAHQRAGRIRRRRAIVTGAVAAVLIPGLAGGAALVVPEMLEQQTSNVGPAANSTGPQTLLGEDDGDGTEEIIEGEEAERLLEEMDEATDEEGDAATDDGATDDGTTEQTTEDPGEEVLAPPWQDGELPELAGGMEDGSIENAWEIPDARPTGVDYLDQFGEPQAGSNYPRLAPISGAMVCNNDTEATEPVSGQRWAYFHDDGGFAAGSVDIHLTGWEDSQGAFEAIRDDTMEFCVRSSDAEWQEVPWPELESGEQEPGEQESGEQEPGEQEPGEQEPGEDFLLYETSDNGLELGFALVRQGDYLVAVTVTDESGEVNTEVAAEISVKMAENLEALDPDHGRG